MDIDKYFSKIDGLKDGLHQYYMTEQITDLRSLNSGRIHEKIGSNETQPKKPSVSFVIIDSKNLYENGCSIVR